MNTIVADILRAIFFPCKHELVVLAVTSEAAVSWTVSVNFFSGTIYNLELSTWKMLYRMS